MLSAICFNLDQSKFLSSSNGLKETYGESNFKSLDTIIFDCMVVSTLLFILWWPVHLSMLSWSSF